MIEAEDIAQKFHEVYEKLAPEHGYVTRRASAVGWQDVPNNQKSLMIATVQYLVDQGIIRLGAGE